MISILHGDAMDPVTSTENSAEMRNDFRDLLGHRIANWQPDTVTVELDIVPQHLNLAGTVHGGVLAALVDIAGSLSGLYCATTGNVRRVVTLSLNTNFTGQTSAGLIRAMGRKRAGGTSIYFSSVEVINEQGQIIALGEVVNRYRRGSESLHGIPALTYQPY